MIIDLNNGKRGAGSEFFAASYQEISHDFFRFVRYKIVSVKRYEKKSQIDMTQIRHLRALQAFDEAANRENLSRAADALLVTHGAVSRQIKQLEEYLGVTLFQRTASGVTKTEAGERLHALTRQVFPVLNAGLRDIRQPRNKRSITISLASSLATKWLVSRLPMFRKKHPELEIFLDTSDDVIDFADSDVDAALRFAKPRSDGLFWEHIAEETLVVVASPQLATGFKRPMSPTEICELPILSDTFDPRWNQWAERAGIADVGQLKPDIQFSDSAVMILAAIDRQGVALARKLLVSDDLQAGRLVRLDGVEIPLDRSLNLVCRTRDKDRPNLQKLRAWLHSLG